MVIARSSQEGIVVNLESLWPAQPRGRPPDQHGRRAGPSRAQRLQAAVVILAAAGMSIWVHATSAHRYLALPGQIMPW